MSPAFHIQLKDNVLSTSFGEPSSNDLIVREVESRMKELKSSGELSGGPLIRINGPASLPAAAVIIHHVAHLYGVVAIFDPKLGKYVVVISHNPAHSLGDLMD